MELNPLVTAVYILRVKDRPCTCDRLALECAVRPPEYLIGLLRAACTNDDVEFGKNYFLTRDAAVFAAVKLNPLGLGDMHAIAAKAAELGKTRVFVIARGVDRRAYRIVQCFEDMRVTHVTTRTVHRSLKQHDALPDLKRIKTKFSLAAFFEAAFRRANLKNYLFSGTLLVAVAFLTPLRIYYLIFGSVSLIMALLTLTPLGKGPFGEEKILDGLCAAPETSSEGEGNSEDGAEPSENAADKADKIPSDGGRGNKSDGTPADGE